jgi:hypothetical protein
MLHVRCQHAIAIVRILGVDMLLEDAAHCVT